jgi:hypothetical protein
MIRSHSVEGQVSRIDERYLSIVNQQMRHNHIDYSSWMWREGFILVSDLRKGKEHIRL